MRNCWSLKGCHMRVDILVTVSWTNGSHYTAGYAEPHDRKQAQHRSEA